ncbi:group III truncated hemoglobin [Flavihumibacter petaseus]|nr:group III truncated hemoglobin [Flavihumibacter petaseus]
MESKKDITTLTDIQLLVNSFYGKVRENAVLGPIFNGVIKDNWQRHLEKMYTFWQTVLLEERTYEGRPFPPHAKLPIDKTHFDTWLGIWTATVDENFTGPVADEAKWRGNKMAELFLYKLEYFRNGSGQALV